MRSQARGWGFGAGSYGLGACGDGLGAGSLGLGAWHIRLIVMLFFLGGIATPASAFGIRPAQTTLDYVSGESIAASFSVDVQAGEDDVFKVYAAGDLAPYITVGKPVLRDGRKVEFEVSLPDNLPPGPVQGRIYVEQAAPQVSLSGGVAAVLRLGHTVTVNVPYPDKYVVATLDVSQAASLVVSTTVENKGSRVVTEATPAVSIDENDQRIAELRSAGQAIPAGQKAVFTSEASPLPAGVYKATAEVAYDGSVAAVARNFQVGEPGISAKMGTTIERGSDAAFDVALRNEWNQPITVVSTITLGSLVASTPEIILEPRKETTVRHYLDTRTLRGLQDATVIVSSAMKNTTVTGKVEITEAAAEGMPNWAWALIMGNAAMLIGTVLVLAWIMRRRTE